MRKISASVWIVLFTLMVSLSSCELIGGIFKAGVWVGVLTVVAVIALVIFIISRLTDKK